MNELKQKHQYITLISSENTPNELIQVQLISGGEVINPAARRLHKSDFFVDVINADEGYPMSIWEIKNGKNN